MLIDHVPHGHPCEICGESAYRHRSEHKPVGDPCTVCGLPASRHRVRSRKQPSKQDFVYLGIDGEGQGRKFHKYVLLAAATEAGKSWWVENFDGLTSIQCLDFILALPQHNTKLFAYSFNYDLTMMLRDLPDDVLFMLFRPELRQRQGAEAIKGPRPVRWNGYKLNLQGTKFTVAKNGRYKVIWDIWKFYQSKFVAALKDWKVGDAALLERMTAMKDQRGEFDKLDPQQVREYCIEECVCMAQLARKLTDAHKAAGLELRSFYGAGSTAAAMLKKMGIREKIKPAPKDMSRAVASAFFGGRFENSVIGEVHGTIYNYDISSAYPYHLCFLPCLLHGTWELTTNRNLIESSHVKAALVHYAMPPQVNNLYLRTPVGAREANPRISDYWAPFPFRTTEGCICFPTSSGGGWVWRDEFIAGEAMFPNVHFVEAWIYRSECACVPFTDIPKYYLERLKIGKEGPGIVIKLGMNSNYGKLAQSVGKGIYNSWIWAGLITSNTRAQILELLALHKDPSNLLMIATDGIQTRERIERPKPKFTGTDIEVVEDKTGKVNRKPLGGWEEDVIEQGVFYARPGIYFPMNPTKEQIKKVRGRGVGKGVVLENHQLILDSWRNYGVHAPARVANVSRFCGAKSTVHRSGPAVRHTYHRADGTQEGAPGQQMPAYGQWITRSVEMSFDPMPKRAHVREDGIYLELRSFPEDQMSMPYTKAIRSFEASQLAAATQEMYEQPDGDLTDYETEEF